MQYQIKLSNGEILTLNCKPSIVSSGVLNVVTDEGKPKLLASYSAGQWKSVELVNFDQFIDSVEVEIE